VPDDLGPLLAALPDSPAELAEQREKIVAALEGFTPTENPLARALLECVATFRERTNELIHDVSGPSHATESLPELEFHQKKTMAIPASVVARADEVEEAVDVDAVVEEATGREHWNDSERLLYEDILALFDLGDQPGAMTSMERLIMLNPNAEELDTFLNKNGDALVKLYQEHFGSLDRVPIALNNGEPVKIPTPVPSMIKDILGLVDGTRTINEILSQSKMDALRTLSSVAHLARSGFIELA